MATPQEKNTDTVIATALNGVVYTENKRLHAENNVMHFIYKFDGSPIGWYARNIKTSDDIYLGVGASPTINLTDIVIMDAEYWASITYTPEEEE
jgi:hypothetical protein